jgi:hypothetical protein
MIGGIGNEILSSTTNATIVKMIETLPEAAQKRNSFENEAFAPAEGIQFVTDDVGKRTAVLINLNDAGEIWEDIYDILVSESRKHEVTIPWKKVKSEMRQKDRKRGRE